MNQKIGKKKYIQFFTAKDELKSPKRLTFELFFKLGRSQKLIFLYFSLNAFVIKN